MYRDSFLILFYRWFFSSSARINDDEYHRRWRIGPSMQPLSLSLSLCSTGNPLSATDFRERKKFIHADWTRIRRSSQQPWLSQVKVFFDNTIGHVLVVLSRHSFVSGWCFLSLFRRVANTKRKERQVIHVFRKKTFPLSHRWPPRPRWRLGVETTLLANAGRQASSTLVT